MFNITSSSEFYAMLVEDFDEFMEDPKSARLAIHCAITATHLREWVWHDWLERDETAKASMGLTDYKSFFAWVESRSIWSSILRELANGSKHFERQLYETALVRGYEQGPYGVGPYGQGYLLIDLGEGVGEGRWLLAAHLLEIVVRFWRDFFAIYRPDHGIKPSKHHNL